MARMLRHAPPFGLAVAVAAVVFAAATPAASEVEPGTLARVEAIRAHVTARYRGLPGRTLVVSEATTTAVVGSLTLVSRSFEVSRRVPADDGIYYALCSRRARCPYPPRSAAWPLAAWLPRRQALELALRTFARTPASLVVVALPTAEPTWVVFEREDLLSTLDLAVGLARLDTDPRDADPFLVERVDRLTRPRLYRPLPVLPPSHETIYAVSVDP